MFMHSSYVKIVWPLILCAGIVLLSAGSGFSDEANDKTYGHAFLGKMILSETASELEEDTQEITINNFQLSFIRPGDSVVDCDRINWPLEDSPPLTDCTPEL